MTCKTLIVGNWKMNHGPEATKQFFNECQQTAFKIPDSIAAGIARPATPDI